MEEEQQAIDPETTMILMGFGKYDLKDMLKWRGTDREGDLVNAAANWPARWRRLRICDPEQNNAMVEYSKFIKEILGEK